MANALYDTGRNAFLRGDLSWNSNTFKVVLLSSSYTANLSTHQYLSSISAGARVATSSALTTLFPGAGVADASDITFTSVSGSQVTQFVIYRDTGVEATSQLVALFDTAINLPITPNGGDITLTWSNDSNRIFKL
jgi:hypothetical protein